jgi:penicillin amidase
LFAVNSSSHYAKEILRARTLITLPDPKRVIDILPDSPEFKNEMTSEVISLLDADNLIRSKKYQPKLDFFNGFVNNRLAGASNSFAANNFRTATEGTLLANDPHFKLSVPSQFYLAHLELSSGGIIGGTIPGIPTVIAGRSPHIGWGISASYADDQDLYAEEINQNDDEKVQVSRWLENI